MKQAELGSSAGVSANTVAFFERGDRTPIPVTLAAIQRALEDAGVEFTDDGGVRPNKNMKE